MKRGMSFKNSSAATMLLDSWPTLKYETSSETTGTPETNGETTEFDDSPTPVFADRLLTRSDLAKSQPAKEHWIRQATALQADPAMTFVHLSTFVHRICPLVRPPLPS